MGVSNVVEDALSPLFKESKGNRYVDKRDSVHRLPAMEAPLTSRVATTTSGTSFISETCSSTDVG
ncbi:hypothetical protein DPMN_097697 [Dreissena polymorpha]|uniref:Uncharacterized protein n=1 Tax=Dreissena polymorpha TaxID=45954 RepID=A0A9D4R4T1_DREPO|nr:hypothetical protein DPMN_097697 [Dreissena polymorpha]